MKMKLQLLLVSVIWLFTHASCALDQDATQIRVRNASEYNFSGVEVNTSDRPVTFGDVNRGKTSGYRHFGIAYSYAFVRLFIGEKEFIIQPIDYVGEKPLGSGKFTYALSVVDFENEVLRITTTRDQ